MLVAALLVTVVLGVAQVALLLHVRSVLTADAAEGARTEAAAGASAGSGATRAHALIAGTLSARVSRAVACTSDRARPPGAPAALPAVVAVTCSGDVGLLLLPGHLHYDVTGHALLERP